MNPVQRMQTAISEIKETARINSDPELAQEASELQEAFDAMQDESSGAELLARGYAWGHADGVAGHIPNGSTMEGIKFGVAYAKHVENGNGSRMSVQRAYGTWKETGTLPNV